MNSNGWLKFVISFIVIAIIFLFFSFLIFVTYQSEASVPQSQNQILSYAKSFFFVTPDLKKDIIVYISIVNENKYKKTQIKTLNIAQLFMKGLIENGFIPVKKIINNPDSISYDIFIVQIKDIIIIAINNFNTGIWEEKIFSNEKDEDIALEISSKLFGRKL